jgi:NAD(P)H-hydrate epimerase
MAILTGMEISAIESDRWAIAEAFAQQWQTTVVLKGALTIIATSTDIWINPISTSALATAGSGDVLSGIIGGFLAQGSSISGAGITGVWLHAQAGLLSSEAIGVEQSVTAMDLLDYIGGAIFNLKEAGI